MAVPWTDAQLDILAKSNFRKTVSNINLSGDRAMDVMAFGLAQSMTLNEMTGAGAGAGAGAGVGAGAAPDQDLDFDFGEIRQGASRGGIRRELNPNLRPIEEDFVDPEILEAFDEFQGRDGAGFDDPELAADLGLDVGFDDIFGAEEAKQPELDLNPAVELGREINYLNVSRFRENSFGIRRLTTCYNQLRRMREEMVSHMGLYSGYYLHAVFSKSGNNVKFGQGAAVNFGTTTPDGETRRVPFNDAVWDFDIHDPVLWSVAAARGDIQFKTSFQENLNNPNSVDMLIERLINSMNANLPQGSDSGALVDGDVRWRFMNLFLVKVLRANAGGPGQFDIDADPSKKISFSRKSVFTPDRTQANTCFWECLFYFMYQRTKGGFSNEGKWYSEMMLDTEQILARRKKSFGAKLKSLATSRAFELRRAYRESCGLQDDNVAVDLNEIEEILRFYDSQNPPLILDKDGDALLGDIVGAEKRRLENDEFTGLWYDSHMHAIISYTGSLLVKKCRRCDLRFQCLTSLNKHLESNKCMKCPCKGPTGHFDDEAEWRFHVESRAMLCPKYRLDSREGSVVSEVDDKGKKLRFLNDAKESYYSKKKKQQDEFDRDMSPIRNYQESIYFDLESVVPMNKAGLSNDEHAHQQPYACGWILRSDAINGQDVNISYGADCMKTFIEKLDAVYDVIVEDEKDLWFRRASEGVVSEPIPKKRKGFCNYSHRVKAHWDHFLACSTTPNCLICDALLDEEHGYTKEEVTGHYKFSNCALRGYAGNTAVKNIDTNFNDNAPRVPVWAHNGGKYDWVFLHRYLMEAGRLDDLQIVRSSSKYFQISFRGVFEFKDSLNFIMGSLDTLGKNFGVETLKGIFPYRLLSSMECIDLVLEGEDVIRERIPHAYLQIVEKLSGPMGLSVKRDMNEEEYVDFFESRGWVYDVRKETVMYLKDDVKCLFGVVEKFRQGWIDMPGSPELFKYCTIGQMCHTYFLDNYLEPEMYPCLDVCEDAYIRRALYGGRTEVFRRVAPAGSKIHYVDVNSLYPYVMESRDLPCGDPTWVFRNDDPTLFQFMNSPYPVLTKAETGDYFDKVKDDLNEGLNDDALYGFFEVDVLCNLEMVYPVLPERRSTDGDKTFKNMFTNMEKRRMVYYSEELKKAISLGCRVLKVWSFCRWNRGSVYKSLIAVLKKQKLLGEGKDVEGNRLPGVAKNPSLRAAAKTAQNSLFGKTIQFIDSGVQLVHTRETLFKALNRSFTKVSIKPVFRSAVSDVVEVTTKFEVPKVQKRSCAAIGTAILAEARLVLYEYFEKVQAVGGEILYCDTDSIVFAGETPLPDDCMDDCAYGKMKVEIDPEEICPGGFVGMSPKCYAFKLVDGAPYVRCKGVNLSQNLDTGEVGDDGISDLLAEMENEEYINNLALPLDDGDVVTTGLNFDKMKALISGDVDVLVTNQMQFLKTTDRMISAYDNVKMMRSHFDKRMLGKDGSTFAWNDFNMNMKKIVTDEDARALSDYLGVVSSVELTQLRDEYKDNNFFYSIFSSWLESDHPNAIYYRFQVDSEECA